MLPDEEFAVLEFKKGNPDALRNWYNKGAAGEINWGVPGDFMQCVGRASNYMSMDEAKGFCANRHHAATGEWPGKGAHKGKFSAMSDRLDSLELAVMTLAEIRLKKISE